MRITNDTYARMYVVCTPPALSQHSGTKNKMICNYFNMDVQLYSNEVKCELSALDIVNVCN